MFRCYIEGCTWSLQHLNLMVTEWWPTKPFLCTFGFTKGKSISIDIIKCSHFAVYASLRRITRLGPHRRFLSLAPTLLFSRATTPFAGRSLFVFKLMRGTMLGRPCAQMKQNSHFESDVMSLTHSSYVNASPNMIAYLQAGQLKCEFESRSFIE